MKAIIFFLSIAFAGSLTAQNWSPILVSEKMNYQHSDSSYISNTIWVDSVETAAENLIYHLNRIVKDVPDNPEIVLRNQPQFLLKQMEDQNNGIFTFSYPGEFTIKTLANPGENWIFNSENNITAEVSSISVQDVFGIQDSVKVISLSDGNEIRLSKSFGILKFPDFENGGNYDLVGIQNTEYGESVPDFWDIFDFEVGDIFQFGEDAGDPFGSGYITRKVVITSKELNSNSYNYEYDGIYHCVFWWAGGGGGIDSYTYSDNFIFTNSINHPVNYFSGQIYVLPNSTTSFGTNIVFAIARYAANTETGVIYKLFGTQYETYSPYSADVFYEISEYSDTLYRLEYASILGDPCGLMGLGYGCSLGETFSSEGCFEFWSLKGLSGYIKDGDTVGTITPDSLLLTNISHPKSISKNWKVYPNPVEDWLNVEQLFSNCPYNLELRNLYGQLVKEENDIQSPHYLMNVGDLKAGVYFYLIRKGWEIAQQGKLIIN